MGGGFEAAFAFAAAAAVAFGAAPPAAGCVGEAIAAFKARGFTVEAHFLGRGKD